MNEVFVADVHKSQRIWTERPDLAVPPAKPGRGRPAKTRQASVEPATVEALTSGFGGRDWQRCGLRDSARGALRVDIACRRVWLWDGEEDAPRCWHLIVRREVRSKRRSSTACPTPPPVRR